MPTPNPYPIVNGVRHSFSSIRLKLRGLVFIGFKSINYSRTRSRTMVYGNHPDPLGKTRGKNEYKADCELYLAEWTSFLNRLGAGYGDLLIPVEVTYSENGFDTTTDYLVGCSIDSTEASNSEGTDPLVRKLELNPVKIFFNMTDDSGLPLRAPP